MNWTQADLDRLAARGMIRADHATAHGRMPSAHESTVKVSNRPEPARASKKAASGGRVPNPWERRARAEVIGPWIASGEVVGEPVYEGVSLRIAEGCRYKPDWACTRPSGALRVLEVKGFQREAARVRLLVAAERWPSVQFYLATRAKGAWIVTRIGEKS